MTGQPAPIDRPIDRRTVLRGAVAVGAVGLTGAGLAGCSSGSGGTSASPAQPIRVPVADVPVGGGAIVEPGPVVVTQPAAGTYKAFRGVCTHQGCPVSSVADDTITCNCHGSQFSAEDGAVKAGPARQPLPALTVAVEGDQLVVS